MDHEEYVHQLEIMNTAIQKSVKKKINPTPSKALGRQGGENFFFYMPNIFSLGKEPLPSAEDEKTLGDGGA